MRVVLINGVVKIVTRMSQSGRPIFTRKKFQGITVAGETESEIVSNFQYYKVAIDKDMRAELSRKQKEGRISLVHFSIEQICGLQGIPPGYSVVEKIHGHI